MKINRIKKKGAVLLTSFNNKKQVKENQEKREAKERSKEKSNKLKDWRENQETLKTNPTKKIAIKLKYWIFAKNVMNIIGFDAQHAKGGYMKIAQFSKNFVLIVVVKKGTKMNNKLCVFDFEYVFV